MPWWSRGQHTRVFPGGEPTGNRRGEVLRGVLALVAIAALVIGVPVALYAGFGTPWPDHAPSNDWIYADFTAKDVLALLVAVVWLAWLHFCLCLIVELVGQRRGRGLSPHVPGGSVGTQPLARRLRRSGPAALGGLAASMPAATAVAAASAAERAHPSRCRRAGRTRRGQGRRSRRGRPADPRSAS